MSKWFPRIIFWGWNSVFLVFIGLLLFTGLLPLMLGAALAGEIPTSFIISLLLIVTIPILSVTLAIKRKDYDQGFLLKLFFGIELPLFLVAIIRIFVLRQMNAGTTLLLLSILFICSYYLWSLYEDRYKIRNGFSALLHTIPSAIMVVFGIGSATFLAIYVPPVAVSLAKSIGQLLTEIFSFGWLNSLEDLITAGYVGIIFSVFLVLLFLSSIVFIIAPVFMVKFYSQAWFRAKNLAAPHISQTTFVVLSLLVCVGWVSAYTASGHQKEATTVAWLEEQENFADVRDKIETQYADIKHDLLNAYLFRYRYLQTRNDTDGVARLYRNVLKLPEGFANSVQALHRFILTPVLYRGEGTDNRVAGELYQEIFDTPIQKAESVAIKKALQATWNRDEAQAGLLDIDSKKVLILEQHIKFEEFSTYASVEIEEVYENKTNEQQEIYYYFALPEDAAITGLWLGFGPDRSKHDEYIVAQRGAAQEVYEREVQRRVDPALLEQVGPRQYRLRAFPIPPRRSFQFALTGDNAFDADAERLRMRFTYAVPKIGSEIAVPRLLEKRNVYWSKKTKRTLNNTPLIETTWLPNAIMASSPSSIIGTEVYLQKSYKVSAAKPQPDASHQSLAVLIDTSFSMRHHDLALKEQLHSLKQDQTVDAEIYLIGANGTASTSENSTLFKPDQALSYFGSLSPQQLLSQFNTMADSKTFDGVIVLTDQGRYVTDDGYKGIGSLAPLWFVHVGLSAYAYDDAVLDIIYRSNGGSTTSLDEALQGIRANVDGKRLSGGKVWTVEMVDASEQEAISAPSKEQAAIAARQIVRFLTKNAKNNLSTLDDIHALAVTHDIVTPWSSMIVLVNERQRKALEEASKEADRFSREANTGEENLSAPTVTGVPEPHEWILIMISLIILMVLWRKRQAFTV